MDKPEMRRQVSLCEKGSMWVGNHRELLVTAFIRQVDEVEFEVPTAVQSIIFKYYPKFENIQFSRYSSFYCETEWNEGHVLRSNYLQSSLHCTRIFASDTGFDQDIHLWKIRYSNANSARGKCGLSTFGCIGVCSNIASIRKHSRRKYEINSVQTGHAYYFDQHARAIFGYRNGEKIDEINHGMGADDDDVTTWFDADEIIVVLDCTRHELKFYINEKHFIGTIQIVAGLKYYPVIQFYSPEDQYEVAEYI